MFIILSFIIKPILIILNRCRYDSLVVLIAKQRRSHNHICRGPIRGKGYVIK